VLTASDVNFFGVSDVNSFSVFNFFCLSTVYASEAIFLLLRKLYVNSPLLGLSSI
jgi:hypothetical protein